MMPRVVGAAQPETQAEVYSRGHGCGGQQGQGGRGTVGYPGQLECQFPEPWEPSEHEPLGVITM